jgi:hypothetical protein
MKSVVYHAPNAVLEIFMESSDFEIGPPLNARGLANFFREKFTNGFKCVLSISRIWAFLGRCGSVRKIQIT